MKKDKLLIHAKANDIMDESQHKRPSYNCISTKFKDMLNQSMVTPVKWWLLLGTN